jgi:hypothetical protein
VLGDIGGGGGEQPVKRGTKGGESPFSRRKGKEGKPLFSTGEKENIDIWIIFGRLWVTDGVEMLKNRSNKPFETIFSLF